MKYEDAVKQLEDIVSRIENGEIDLDALSKELQKAQKLIKLCRDKLTKVDNDIQQIINNKE